MKDMATITVLLTFVFSILSIVLFFKIWGMCNDISIIRKDIHDFTKYYYKMQEYKNKKTEVS